MMKLPPLNAMRAFEAAARHGGYIAAAEELHVTRGAISRHVKQLEDHLGLALFVRRAQGVRLTVAGERLRDVLGEAFGMIARETGRITTDAADLHVICPPATSIRWLIPRLGDFQEAHPDIHVRLTTDFHGSAEQAYDIGFSVSNWPGRAADVETLPLFPILLTPAVSPRLLEGQGAVTSPDDLARLLLLHETSRRADWTAWIEAFGLKSIDPTSGDIFPNLDMAVKAAVMGAGVVMTDLVLCREELRSGALIAPFPEMVCPSPYGQVCLLGARRTWHDPKVEAFKAWAVQAAAEDLRLIEVTRGSTTIPMR